MSLIDHYAALRHTHITFVSASGALFAVRAFARLSGAAWPLGKPARMASWIVDTGLLAAGALLWAALGLNPLVQTWLGTKLLLLLVYIGLGTMALRRARTSTSSLAWTIAALGCFGFMVSVALAHDPAGLFAHLRTSLP